VPQLQQPDKLEEEVAKTMRIGTLAEEERPGLAEEASKTPIVIADLTKLGVRVCLVPIKIGGGSEPFFRQMLAGKNPTVPPGDDFLIELTTLDFSSTTERAKESKNQVIQDLLKELRRPRDDVIQVQRNGRVVDNRALSRRVAPDTHWLLDATNPEPLEPYHAVVADHVLKKLLPDGPEKWPLVASHILGEGRIIVVGFSPFALDMWQPDVLRSLWEKSQTTGYERVGLNDRADGWGVQRLIDLISLSGAPQPLRPYPVVRRVRELSDGSTLQLECWAGSADKQDWGMPTLLEDEKDQDKKDKKPLPSDFGLWQIVDADPLRQAVTYQFIASKPLVGRYTLQPHANARDEDIPNIYLRLRPATGTGRSVYERLGHIAVLSGGGEVRNAAEQLKFRRPVSWAGGLGLCLVLVVLFLVRPWTALRITIRRLRERRGVAREGELTLAGTFDIQAVLAEWGLNPGMPNASRQAGQPAGQKPYESGNALAAALQATLFPFTTPGRMLPPRRPIVRQRHITRAMEALILLDASRGLGTPAASRFVGKPKFIEAVVHLLAESVWIQAGSVRVSSLQDPQEVWGPRAASDEATDLTEFVRSQVAHGLERRRRAILRRREDVQPGQVLFLVTDLCSLETAELRRFAAEHNQEAVQVRLVHVRDADEPELVGLCWDPEVRAYYDRSEWDPSELAEAYRQLTEAVAHEIEAEDGRFVSVSTDLSLNSLCERLRESGMLA
jgi:hypothetical protein